MKLRVIGFNICDDCIEMKCCTNKANIASWRLSSHSCTESLQVSKLGIQIQIFMSSRILLSAAVFDEPSARLVGDAPKCRIGGAQCVRNERVGMPNLRYVAFIQRKYGLKPNQIRNFD